MFNLTKINRLRCNNVSVTLESNYHACECTDSIFLSWDSAPFLSPRLCTTCLSRWNQFSCGDWQVWYLAFTSRLKMSHAAAGLVCVPGKHPSPANAQPCQRLSRSVNIHLGGSIPPAPPATNSAPLVFSYQTKCYPFQLSPLTEVYTRPLRQGVWFHHSL